MPGLGSGLVFLAPDFGPWLVGKLRLRPLPAPELRGSPSCDPPHREAIDLQSGETLDLDSGHKELRERLLIGFDNSIAAT